MVGGDFIVILNEEEKLGGLEFIQMEAIEFAQCINACALSEVNFSESKYTWWNNRINEESIFKSLDKVLVNSEFWECCPIMEAQQLTRRGSDHAPIQIVGHTEGMKIVKLFRFINFWCNKNTFKETVKQNWTVDFVGDPFMVLHAKLKKIKGYFHTGLRIIMKIFLIRGPHWKILLELRRQVWK